MVGSIFVATRKWWKILPRSLTASFPLKHGWFPGRRDNHFLLGPGPFSGAMLLNFWRVKSSKKSIVELPPPTLPETHSEFTPENRPFAPKGNDRIPTIHFQVLLRLVSGRVVFFRYLKSEGRLTISCKSWREIRRGISIQKCLLNSIEFDPSPIACSKMK